MSSSELFYYPSGALYAKISEKMREYYYENGQLKTVEHYRGDSLDQTAVLYWPNGLLKRKCSFVLGVREGLDQMWNEKGELVDEQKYSQGKPRA